MDNKLREPLTKLDRRTVAGRTVQEALGIEIGAFDDWEYTADEIAKRRRVPLSWVRERSRPNTPCAKIPVLRVGRYCRYSLRAFDLWCELEQKRKEASR